jgi:hypothetical protein
MNIIEAVKLLLDGKKIRLSYWRKGNYLQRYSPDPSLVLNQWNEECKISLTEMIEDCWEILEDR